MKKYDTYKDSGNQWIGQVPEHWAILPMKHCANLFTGNSISDKDKENYSDASDAYPYIATKDINAQTLLADYKNGMYTKKEDASFKIASKGSTLLCIEGGSAGRKKTYLTEDVSFVNKLCCFTAKEAMSGKYLYYYINSNEFVEMFNNHITGLIGGVSLSQLVNFKAPLPPLSEQQAIVEFLDKKTGQIDQSIALLETQKTDLQAYRQVLITETVTKGLNPNAPMKDSGIQWIGKIPEHWNTSKLKYMGESRNGLTYSPNDVTESGVLVLRSSNIQDSRLAFNDNVYVEKAPDFLRMHKGDLLICSRNGSISLVGKCAYIPEDMDAVFGAFMLRYRPNKPNRFVYYVVQDAIRNYKAFYATSTVNQLTVDIFGNMNVPLPPLSEQQVIADYLDKKTHDIDAALTQIDNQITDLQAYRTALISEVVTGKIDVRNQ